MTTRQPPRKRRRKGSKRPGLLEDCVQLLEMLGFHEYSNYKSFQRAEIIGPRYVIRRYPHPALYGTRGSKEGFIVAPDGAGLFVPDDDGIARIIVEAKWQEGSGSTDEKLPYVWEAFLASHVRNWIVVLDGGFWDTTERGKAATAWLQAKTPGPEGRRFHVVDRRGFRDLIKRAWGQP